MIGMTSDCISAESVYRGRTALVVNARSRSGQAQYREAIAALSARGITLDEHIQVNNPAHLVGTVRGIVKRKAQLVIVGGGDGSLSSVLPCFVGHETVMGVLPLGTGNQFARDLGISADISSACDVIVSGKVSCVDLGMVNDRLFLNVATVGLTTLIAQSLTAPAKKKFGRAVYVFALASALTRVRPFRLTMSIVPPPAVTKAVPPDVNAPQATAPEMLDMPTPRTETIQTMQIVIGNGRFHAGPFPLAPDASITDGRLVVYAIAGASRWKLLKMALNLPGGRQVMLDDVHAYNAVEGTVVTSPHQRVTVDGEVALRTPLSFRVVPKALRVLTPESFT
jgi:diacylglycerol kinase family enzyme